MSILSISRLAILLWSVAISSLIGPLIFSALLHFSASSSGDTQNYSVGIVWVAQYGDAPAETMQLVVAGFTPDSCARERGVALGDVLIAFRSSEAGELIHVSRLLDDNKQGASAQAKGNGLETGQPGNILLVHKAMVGEHGSICELHLLRRVDEAGTSPSVFPLSGMVSDVAVATSPNFSPLSAMVSSRNPIDTPAVEFEVASYGLGGGGGEEKWTGNDFGQSGERGGHSSDHIQSDIHRVKAAMSRLRDALEQEDLANFRAVGATKVEVHGRRFGGYGGADEEGATVVASPSSRRLTAGLPRPGFPENGGVGWSPDWSGANGENGPNERDASPLMFRDPRSREEQAIWRSDTPTRAQARYGQLASIQRSLDAIPAVVSPYMRSPSHPGAGLPERVLVVQVPRTCAGRGLEGLVRLM